MDFQPFEDLGKDVSQELREYFFNKYGFSFHIKAGLWSYRCRVNNRNHEIGGFKTRAAAEDSALGVILSAAEEFV